jgi:Domain of unknown function (DUF4439)
MTSQGRQGRTGHVVDALQVALAAEQAASYGYGIVGSHLHGAKFTASSADCVEHERARDLLGTMITARGAQPRAASVAYKLPTAVGNSSEAVALAIILERQVAAAYLSLVALPDPALRAFGARMMAAAAVRAARWGARTQAFPGLPAPR